MIRFDLRLLTGLGAFALLGCPGDDSATPDDGDDTETSSSTGPAVTTTPMTADSTTGDDVTSSGPDTDDTTDTGEPTDTGSESSTTESDSTSGSDSSSGSESSSDGPMCDVDEIVCDGSCVDPMTDSDYCGAVDDCVGANAGTFCEADQNCIDGSCECMNLNALLCPIGCIDPLTDPVYCGATDDCLAENAGVDCEDDQSCVDGSCECDDMAQVVCDGACIDPMTNSDYCGAMNDCTGMDAGEVCSPSATCMAGGCVDTCDNCSFETGDFTGWDATDLSAPFLPLQVGAAGLSTTAGAWTSFSSAPTDGTFACLSGFDGDGSTGATNVISIGQDITLAADPPADLEFDYRAAWDLANFGMPMFDRTLEVHIEPAGGGAPMQTDTILTAQAGTVTEDNGDMTGVVDLSAFAGSTVYVRIVQTVPEDFTGPGFMQIDNVRVVAQ